jgi:hypothetical protein
MMVRLIAAVLCALIALPGQGWSQDGGDDGKAFRSDKLHVTIRAPEPEKWVSGRSRDGTRRIFKCKPLACPEAQTVVFSFRKSPVRNPDPKALERFAKVDLPKSTRALGAAREVMTNGAEKIETLRSDPAKLKGYPAVLNETKLSRGTTDIYLEIAIIFAGPVMIRVQAFSKAQELAQNTLQQFVEAMKIEKRPSAPAAPKPGAPGGATRSL